jgi:hypothetical protein
LRVFPVLALVVLSVAGCSSTDANRAHPGLAKQQAVPVIDVLAPPDPNEPERIHLAAQLSGVLSFQSNCTVILTKRGDHLTPIFPDGTSVIRRENSFFVTNKRARLRLQYGREVALGGGFGNDVSQLQFAHFQQGCGERYFVISPNN